MSRKASRPFDRITVTIEQNNEEVDVLKKANRLLRCWAVLMLADESEIVDVAITYEDGKILRTHYEMRGERGGVDPLGEHLGRVMRLHAGELKPGHLTDEQYREVLAQNQKRTDRNRQWLAGYRIIERLV